MLIDKELIIKAKNKYGEDAAILIAKDLKINEWDEKNLKGCCPFHNEDHPSFIWDSKPNANFFKCFGGCGKTYNIIDHFMSFYKLTYLEAVEKLFGLVGEKYRFGERGLKSSRDYIYPNHENNPDRSKIEQYLAKRKISVETLDYTDIQADSHNNIVFHFYDENDVLMLVKYRPAKQVTKGDLKSWCQKDKDSKHILFNMNRIDPTKPLVITEGEIDCLSVIESGYRNCVSIPLGSQDMKWIETNWDWLEQFDKIIVWSDNDDAGIKMRRDACARLGAWRTLFVDVPNEIIGSDEKSYRVKDANEILFLLGKETVINYINNAQEIPVEGVIDLSQVDEFDIENALGLFPGLKSVENIVYKFLFGSVAIVTGMRGAGKSTLINQMFICEPLHQGFDVFCFSGELAPPVLKSWIELSMAGPEHTKMKDGNSFVHIIESDSKKKMREWYEGRIWIYNQISQKSKDIIRKAIDVTRKYGVKVWVLDNLTTIDIDASDDNSNQKQKDFIVELIKTAALYGVLIILVIHPRKIQNGQELENNDVAGSSSLTDLAQYVAKIKRFSKKEQAGTKDSKGNYKKGCEPINEDVEMGIMKNRYTGKIGEVRMFFDYTSYRFYNTLEEAYKRFKWDEKNEKPIPIKELRESPFNKGT